ncbi:glycoside hydrolase family 16 protein [Mucilaginibacter sp. HMF5004]|uniref:glycoside hydrolase family 16 protein n=1 Tax=Mucilaginibacter rivuli TaxID=2857527 RepID=UPI001C5F672A|nr:glycoside hydrolase family 16 protein [Mucilaginibacter rivuli]MBW4891036.1 glycoside hydrolase family 16 protein [Mucilaginibacter rivuli]
MSLKIALCAFVFCGLSQYVDGQSKNPTNDLPGYHLVWSDEFNKDGHPDTANWSFETGFKRNHELQWYQQDNAFCKGGLCIIEAKRVHLPNPNYVAGSTDWRTNREFIDYTSTSMNTHKKHNWQYGRFIMRARIDIDAGLWPAFWTLGEHKPWPSSGEVDIMEYYRGKLLANVIFGTNRQYKAVYNSSAKPVVDFGAEWSKAFHVWEMDWDETGIRLYVDGLLLKDAKMQDIINQDGSNFNPFMQEHYILLDLALGGDNGGDPTPTQFPRTFAIDYVRVYQKNHP